MRVVTRLGRVEEDQLVHGRINDELVSETVHGRLGDFDAFKDEVFAFLNR